MRWRHPAVLPLLALICWGGLLKGQSDEFSLEKIIIAGNTSFSEKQLLGLMKLQSGGLFGGAPFSRRALRIDAITIRTFYQSQGYLEAVVADSFAVTSKRGISAFITIHEGSRFNLDKINISGNRILSTSEIIEFLDLKEGDTFNSVALRGQMERLQKHYQDKGKLAVDLIHETELGTAINLQISIFEGPTFIIGKISISGLDRVPRRYLERELLFMTGDQFNRSILVRSQQRVFQSGLFGAVEIIPVVNAETDTIADIDIRVRELDRRSIDLTLGFLQKESPGGGVPVTALSGSGQWWHSRVMNSSVRTGLTVEADFVLGEAGTPNLLLAWDILSPWTLGFRVPTSFRLFSDYRTTPEFFWSSGLEISLISSRTRRNQWRGGFSWVFIRASDLDASIASGGTDRSIEGSYLHQGVDNLLEPHRGTIFRVEPSLHQTFLPGNPFYFKLEADLRRYHSIFNWAVFAYRIKIGYLATLPTGTRLVRFDRFELGGSTSLRGWRDPNSFAEEGGDLLALINTEIRSPLLWRLGLELFVDAGWLRTYPELEGVEMSGKMGVDAGAGIYITTPLGPIRVDYAYPVSGFDNPEPSIQAAFLYIF